MLMDQVNNLVSVYLTVALSFRFLLFSSCFSSISVCIFLRPTFFHHSCGFVEFVKYTRFPFEINWRWSTLGEEYFYLRRLTDSQVFAVVGSNDA